MSDNQPKTSDGRHGTTNGTEPTIRRLLRDGVHVKATGVDVIGPDEPGRPSIVLAHLADQPLDTLPDRTLDRRIDMLETTTEGGLRIHVR